MDVALKKGAFAGEERDEKDPWEGGCARSFKVRLGKRRGSAWRWEIEKRLTVEVGERV